MTFKVKSREFGRGPVHTESFATLVEAQQYIKDRWQGADYMDGKTGFHTDYCTYQLVGFTLDDIGETKVEWDTDETGKPIFGYQEYFFKDLSAEAA